MTTTHGNVAIEAREDAWAVLRDDDLDAISCGRPVSPSASAPEAATLLTMLALDGGVRLASIRHIAD